jgi:pimeloyl-ACP methyl ester carboxylesterase
MTKFSNLFLLLILTSVGNVQSQIIDTLIKVGNHDLHFKLVKGKGTPILFESGNGDDGSVWENILKPIHDSTGATLITYDRAGLGKSEIDTVSINFGQEIKDLEYALKQLGFNKELFIVSHSFGGFYTTLFADRNHDKIKGAVYIDVALPCFFTKEWSRSFTNNISNENWKVIKQRKAGLFYVLKNLERIAEYMSDKSLAVNIPVTLIAAEKLPAMIRQDETGTWTGCLKAFGTLPNHSYVLANNSGHKVWEDNPKIVIDEVIKLYKRTK